MYPYSWDVTSTNEIYSGRKDASAFPFMKYAYVGRQQTISVIRGPDVNLRARILSVEDLAGWLASARRRPSAVCQKTTDRFLFSIVKRGRDGGSAYSLARRFSPRSFIRDNRPSFLCPSTRNASQWQKVKGLAEGSRRLRK